MGDNSNTRGRTAATRPLDHKPGLRPIGSGLIRADGPTGRSALARAIHASTAVKLAPAVAIGIEEWRAADWPERRRLRCLAHAHAHPALVLTGVSAARVLGLAILVDPDRETDEPVHLAHVGRGKTKNGSGHVVRSLCLEESDITIVDGVRTTTAARTIHDLRETHGPEHARRHRRCTAARPRPRRNFGSRNPPAGKPDARGEGDGGGCDACIDAVGEPG